MKKVIKKLWGFIFILVLLRCNLFVSATEGTVSELTLYHEHSGSESGGGCYNQPNYHMHEGNSTNGGNCYTAVYHVHHGDPTNGGTCYRENTCGGKTVTIYGSHYLHKCTVCGNIIARGNGGGEGADVEATPGEVCENTKCSQKFYALNCSKTNSIESYELTCTKNDTTIDSYSLNCEKTPDTVVGKLQLNKVSSGQYCLSVSASNAVINSCVWSNGESGQSIFVTGNQEYSCEISYNIEERSETAVLRYNVTDFDLVGPKVTIHYDNSTREKSKTITVEAYDTGVGLHSTPYRYHNGTSWSEWTNKASYKITSNGVYGIEVRDALGNTEIKEIVINTIGSDTSSVSVNTSKPVVEEKRPETVEIQVPNVEKASSKEEESRKDNLEPKEKETKVIVESGTIDVKNAMSEQEPIVYQTITETEHVLEEKIVNGYERMPSAEQSHRAFNANEYSQMGCCLGVIGVPFLCFWCLGNTKIYRINEQGKRKFLCRAFLSKKGKLKISRFYLKKNKSKTILIKPSKAILKKKRGKAIDIRIGERDFSKVIQEEIFVEY